MKINGKTPEEIINATRCCLPQDEERCYYCAYSGEIGCYEIRISDTVSLIQQLKRERDAAIKDLRDNVDVECWVCKHRPEGGGFCARIMDNGECWEWCRAEEGLNDEQDT